MPLQFLLLCRRYLLYDSKGYLVFICSDHAIYQISVNVKQKLDSGYMFLVQNLESST